MVLNLHPWNWSLIAKKNWQHYGGRKDIIVAIHHEYTELYGQPYIEWRQGHALDLALGKSMIAYSYGNKPSQKTQRIEPVSPTSIFSSRRPVIKRGWIGTGIVLSLHLASGKCEFPHDELLTWVSQNTKALSTISWNRDGIYHEGSGAKPYYGLGASYHDIADSKMHLRFTLRNGVFNGPVEGWNPAGTPVYTAEYKEGKLISDRYTGPGTKEEFLAAKSGDLRAVKYHPAPPIPEVGNWLGTTSEGYDVLAYLYGGLQVNFKAAIIYLPIIYFIGITMGMMTDCHGSCL